MKKLFTFLLAIVASIGTMFAASGKCGENLTWELTDDVLTISGTGAMNNYSLGSTGSSTAPWNSYSSSIKSIIIKWGVTSIGEYAFNNCSRLQSVEIPNSVVSIGSHAFSGCVRMDSVNFGNGVTSIGSYAFRDCSSLTSVTIPNSVTSIGNWAFSYCSGLTSVTIGNSVTGIGRNAFGGCNSLTAVHILDLAAWCKIQFGEDAANPLSYAHNLYVNGELVTDLVIPNSVTSIKYKAFSGCTSLTSVTIPNSVTSIGNNAFVSCTGLTSVTIPNSVTSIGDWAFYNCSSLTSVTIPNSVTSIGIKVFHSCSGLTSVTIPNSVANIGSGAFYGCKISTIDYIGDIEEWLNKSWSPSDLSSGYSLLLNGSILEKVTIPDNVKSIKDNTFLNCISLTSVMIPDGVTKIGSSAFSGCTSLIYVTIPNSVINIGSDAFKNVPNIVYYGTATGSQWGAKSINGFAVGYFVYSDDTKATLTACSASAQGKITIPNSVTSIGKSAFYGCTNLTSVTIPNSVTSIGSSAFQECTSLTSVTIPNSVTGIGSYAFYGCSSLTSVTIPNSVTSIEDGAFDGCSSLTSVTIPNSVTSIGRWAFEGCTGLTSVTIGNSVTSIGRDAFYKCSGLTSVTIPNSVTSIGSRAFWGCSSLTFITIPNNVTGIGGYAFTGSKINTINYVGELKDWCEKLWSPSDLSSGYSLLLNGSLLENVTIPNNVTSIGNYAFIHCSGLTSVTIGNSVTSIGNYAFSGCNGLTSVTIPNSVTSIGSDAFDGCSGLTKIIVNDVAAWCKIDFANLSSNPLYYAHLLYLNDAEINSLIIPDNVTSIGDYTFYNCSNLTSVTIPNSVTSIGNSAFYGCTGLTSVTIPNSVTSIGNDAFYNVQNIMYQGTATGLPWGAKNINLFMDGYLLFSDETRTTLLACSREADGIIEIPNSVTSIGSSTFSGCTGLTSVTIPNSVTSIGDYAFYNCSKLNSITIEATTPPYLGDEAFNSTNYCPIIVPCDAVAVYKEKWSGYADRIVGNNCKSSYTITFANWDGKVLLSSQVEGGTLPEYTGATPERAEDEKYTYTFSGWSPTIVAATADATYTATYEATQKVNNSCGENLTWDLTDGVLTIRGTGAMEDYKIASKVPWYAYCYSISSVIIEEGVTSIGNWAFYDCSGLTSVTIPNSITNIGEYAFRNCSSLRTITIPYNVTNIGVGAFFNCSSLTSVIWNAKNCEGTAIFTNGIQEYPITSFIFGDGVETIPDQLCQYMGNLTSITIPNSVTSIGKYVFARCGGLTSVTIGNSVTSIGNWAFEYCTGLTSVTIPNSVTSIGDYTFEGCSSLTSVTIGKNVTNIGSSVFQDCNKVTSVVWNAKNCNSYRFGAQVESFVFGDEVEIIPDQICFGMNKLTTIKIPNSVTSIGEGAFANCSGLTSVAIPNSVTSIGEGAFNGCSGLTSVTIPNSVTSIGNNAFYECTSLTSVTIGNSVTSIDPFIFQYCSNLKTIDIDADNPNYSSVDGVLYNKDKTTLILCPGRKQGAFDIPNSVTSIGSRAFAYCSSLTSVTIPNSVTSIGEGAFAYCSSLTSATIPNSVTSIGDYAFYLCSSLTSIEIPNSVTSIGEGAFYLCSSLTSIEIPNSVTSIGEGAFAYCSSLTSVIVGNGVKEIVSPTFSGCPLKNITLGTGLRKMSVGAFPYNVMIDGYDEDGLPMPKTDASGNFIYTVEKVVCYAKVPPTIELSGASDYKGFLDNFAEAVIYVPQESVSRYQAYTETWGRLDIRPIKAESVTTDNLVITPSETSADIVWPAVSGAATYELVIKDKQGNIICTLIFNANGQLASIAFHAPARGDAPQQTQAAGFSFTVTGLDSGSSYDLTMASKDEKGNTIDEKHLSFSTTGDSPTAIDAVETSKLGGSTKILRDGQVYIERNGKIYTVTGAEVR